MNLYQEIAQRLKDADTVIIGASNGLSISEGLNIFADDLWFQENFGDFREKYGIHSLIEGAFCRFSSEQEKWAFTSRYVSKKSYLEPPSRMMRQLYDLVKEKDYFVVTTNEEDHFVPAGFSPERVFEMEGKNTEMRCSRGCCDEVYYNREAILCMAQAEQNGVVPQELLPVCPRCGGPMDVNMANNQRFFQTRRWQEKMRTYQSFMKQHHKSRIIVLELGVGRRNSLIKAPLLQLAQIAPQLTYVIFNKGELNIPPEIASKAIGVDGDIAEALNRIYQNIYPDCSE